MSTAHRSTTDGRELEARTSRDWDVPQEEHPQRAIRLLEIPKLLSGHMGRHFVCMISPSPPRVRLFSVTESVVLTPHPTAVHHMPESHTRAEPSLLPIERPRCPKCQNRMMLARIEPGANRSDLRTFECPKCEYVHKMLVEDPLKSSHIGWMAGDLKPPK